MDKTLKISFLRIGLFSVFFVIGVLASVTTRAQLPTAQEVASKMKVGWNLGNTLEAICGEDAWGAGHTSQKLIDSVKAAGFNTVRIPVAWFCHSDTINNIIDEEWLARVKEVVDYCINDDLYVIINAHWDKGWLENRVNKANQSKVNERQEAYWTQIAEYFIDYDEHLLFAGANEPNAHDANAMSVLLTYHQTFIDAVRATGGNNSSRTLIVQGPSTDIDETNKLMNTLPTDQIENRLMVEIHYYTPYQFCLMDKDADWGKMFYYWGKEYHSKTDVSRNATWGEESDVEKLYGMMKSKFIDKGIPVIMGEYGAYKRKLSPPSEQDLHNASVEYFYRYTVKSATSKGIITYCWDTPGGLFDRSKGTIRDRGIVDAIMQGAKDAKTSYITLKNNNMEVYPNPFTSTFSIKVDNLDNIDSISIFDMTGKKVESIVNIKDKNSITLGASLKANVYLVMVYGTDWTESFKVVKE
jgi:aryl-phospho-beta-D-glucosidase BglC (GH1 family)